MMKRGRDDCCNDGDEEEGEVVVKKRFIDVGIVIDYEDILVFYFILFYFILFYLFIYLFIAYFRIR